MKREDELEAWTYYLKHKHCPICGQVIESEDETAYYHIYVPTRCEKSKQ